MRTRGFGITFGVTGATKAASKLRLLWIREFRSGEGFEVKGGIPTEE